MMLIDLKWLSEIFNDTKHRADSLRQLNFLYRHQFGVGWCSSYSEMSAGVILIYVGVKVCVVEMNGDVSVGDV